MIKLGFRAKQVVLAFLAGGTLLQLTTCNDVTLWITAIATTVTAGAALWIVQQIRGA